MMNSSVRRILSTSSNALRSNWSPATLRYSSDDAAKKEKKKKGPLTKDRVFSVRARGSDLMRDPGINKGVAFTLRERQLMGLHGLLPPVIKTQDEQVFAVMQNFLRWDNDLDRYIYLMGIQDRNEKLFFRVINEYVEQMLPIVYTPTVGLICQKYGVVYRKPRGLFITIHDRGHVYEILSNWSQAKIKAIVVTDGERILGLGDLGAQGMGIPVGKLALYTALAGIPPQYCLPVMIDCGTNNQELLDDPLYIGLRQKRDKGPEYVALMDEFMDAVVRRYGPNCLVQFEDFGNHNAFHFLDRYRNKHCTFNDDIQGTAAVALSGILASLRVTGTRLTDNKYLFLGAGEAAFGIARFLASALRNEGLTEQEAYARIWLFDKDGLLVRDRPEGGVDEMRKPFAKDMAPLRSFEEAIHLIKPTAIIGASGVGGLFTPGVLRAMAQYNDRPIVFALSNPTSRAECTAEDAYRYTNGKCVFASGSPFKAVTTEGGRTIYPGQGNNAYIFPGVALAVTMCGIPRITEEMFIVAAKTLSEMVKDEHLAEGRIYPPLSQILKVSLRIATRVAEHSYARGEAHYFPEPADKEEFLRSQLYSTDYESFEPNVYPWPESITQ